MTSLSPIIRREERAYGGSEGRAFPAAGNEGQCTGKPVFGGGSQNVTGKGGQGFAHWSAHATLNLSAFNSRRFTKATGSLFSSRVQACKQARGGFTHCFNVLLSAVAHATTVIRGVSDGRKKLWQICQN